MNKAASKFLLLLLCLELWGQRASERSRPDPSPRYLLLATSRTSTLQRELEKAAKAGYRVAMGCKPQHYGEWLVVMEKVAQPPAIYDYKLLATQLTSTMQRELEAAAAHGYRVVPRAMMGEDEIVMILEKPPPVGAPADHEKPDAVSAGFDYQVLATTLTGTLQKELTEETGRGFTPVGLLSRREHIAILEHPRQPTGAPKEPKPVPRYRLLATKRTSTMQRELNDALSGGFRILASSPTSETEIMILLEEQRCDRCEYKLIAANRLSTVEKELNENAAKGFRLLWRTAVWKRGAGIPGEVSSDIPRAPGEVTLQSFEPDEIVAVMEKTSEAQGRYQYRVQGAVIASTIQKKFNHPAQEGYRVAALLGHPDPELSLWPVLAHIVVIFEKPPTK